MACLQPNGLKFVAFDVFPAILELVFPHLPNLPEILQLAEQSLICDYNRMQMVLERDNVDDL